MLRVRSEGSYEGMDEEQMEEWYGAKERIKDLDHQNDEPRTGGLEKRHAYQQFKQDIYHSTYAQ